MADQEQGPAVPFREPAGLQDPVEIGQEVVHRGDVDPPGIGERAVRQPLPAPVEAEHPVPARLQLADGLEVLLDELAEPGKQDGSHPRRPARREDGKPHPGPVGGRPDLFGARVVADCGRLACRHERSTTALSSSQSRATPVPGPGIPPAPRATLARDTRTRPSAPGAQRTR